LKYESNRRKNWFYVSSRDASKILGHKKRKTTNHVREIFFPHALMLPIVLNFGVRGEIADIIAQVIFYINRFRGFGAVTLGNLGISIRMAGGSCNSVSTAVLQCTL